MTVGARFVLDFDYLKSVIDRLIEVLVSNYSEQLSERVILEYHTYYMIYTILYQSITTGMRAISGPHELYRAWLIAGGPTAEIISATQDKGSKYCDKARAILITRDLACQYSYYSKHRERLLILLPNLRAWLSLPGGDDPFGLVSGHTPIERLTPSWLGEFLRIYLGHDIQVNFNRAFLRTELLARGCPGENIDAFLGHANRGESPFGPLSTFDYELHFKQIRKSLSEICSELGLRPIGSRLIQTVRKT